MSPCTFLVEFCIIACVLGKKHATTIDRFPFLVSIRRNILEIENFTAVHVCSGVIISKTEILTTASCLHDVAGNLLHSAFSFTIVAGATNLKSNQFIERFSTFAKIHPKFRLGSTDNDLGLIYLDKQLPTNSKTIDLAKLETREIEEGVTCSIVGWGATAMQPFVNLSGELFTNEVQVNKDCSVFLFYEYDLQMNDTQLCAGTLNTTKETCFQDTGSPLVCSNRVVGLANVYNNCPDGQDKGTVYMKISKFLNFIYGQSTDAIQFRARNGVAVVEDVIFNIVLMTCLFLI